MGRPLRIEFDGALYHIMSQGNGRLWIYKNDIDLKNFIDILFEIKQKYKFKYHSVILMRNHYHLLLETLQANLSLGMAKLNSSFAQKYNKNHNHKGNVFQHRFKSLLIEKGSYFLNVYRYINQNACRAGICNNMLNYKGNLLTHQLNKKYKRELLSFDVISEHFTKINKLIDWLNEEIETNPFKKTRENYFLGNMKWIKEIKNKYLKKEISEEILGRKKLIEETDKLGVIFRELQKYQNDKEYLNLQIYFLNKYSGLRQREIAEKLNLKNQRVIRQRLYDFKNKIDNSSKLKNIINQIEKKSDIL